MSDNQWCAVLDFKTNRPYFVHRTTLQTTWNKPIQGPVTEIDCGDGWLMILDPNTNKYYYANRTTKETTWVEPSVLTAKRPQNRLPTTSDGSTSSSSSSSTSNPTFPLPQTAAQQNLDDPAKALLSPAKKLPPPLPSSNNPVSTNQSDPSTPVSVDSPLSTPTLSTPSNSTPATPTACHRPLSNSLSSNSSSQQFSSFSKSLTASTPSYQTLPASFLTASAPQPTHSASQHRPHYNSLPGPISAAETKERPTLPAPVREDILKFASQGFASVHFREFKRKTGLIRSTRIPVADLMRFSPLPLEKPLLSATKKSSEAVKLFSYIQQIMGDQQIKKPIPTLLASIIDYGVQRPQLRDEIYCQLSKQTNENYDQKSCLNGWKILACVCSAFAPTREFQVYVTKHILDSYSKEGPIGQVAAFCYFRFHKTLKEGADDRGVITWQQIEDYAQNGVPPYFVSFGGSINYILQLQRQQQNFSPIPHIVELLCNTVRDRGGFHMKGIFRIAAQKDDIFRVRALLMEGNTKCLEQEDCHIAADLLKIFLRDLSDPIIPLSLYDACLKASDSQQACIDLLKDLQQSHYDTLDYLLTFLADLANYQAETAMSEENLAIVFCTDILRTDEKDPSILFKNSPREKNFVRHLIIAWRTNNKTQR